MRIAIGSGTKGQRIHVIDFMLHAVASERPQVEELLLKLRIIAERPFGIGGRGGVASAIPR